MSRSFKILATIAAAGVFCAALSGCAAGNQRGEPSGIAPTPEPETLAVEEQQEVAGEATEAAQEAEEQAEEQAKKEAEEEEKQEAKKAREREHKRAKLRRNLEMAQLRLNKARLDLGDARIKQIESFKKAQDDLELATKKLNILKDVTAPNRVARAELNLQRGEDGLKDAREELQQLELMYSDEQFADKTKEIVIERAKRRLERTERDLELRGKEHKTLVEVTIPLEMLEHERKVEEKTLALEQLRRDDAKTMIDKQLAQLKAELEVFGLEHELEDILKEIEEAKQKKTEQKQEKVEENAG